MRGKIQKKNYKRVHYNNRRHLGTSKILYIPEECRPMGNFDVFYDLEKNRVTQSKAFTCRLNEYFVGDEVGANDGEGTYFVETEIPFRFIFVENGKFVGILDIAQIDRTNFPETVFDYHGTKYSLNNIQTNGLISFSEVWEKYFLKLPLNKSDEVFKSLPYEFKELYLYDTRRQPVYSNSFIPSSIDKPEEISKTLNALYAQVNALNKIVNELVEKLTRGEQE